MAAIFQGPSFVQILEVAHVEQEALGSVRRVIWILVVLQ